MDLSQFLLFLVYPIIKPEQKTLSPTWKIQRLYWRVFQILWKCNTSLYGLQRQNRHSSIPLDFFIQIVRNYKYCQFRKGITNCNCHFKVQHKIKMAVLEKCSTAYFFYFYIFWLNLPLLFGSVVVTSMFRTAKNYNFAIFSHFKVIVYMVKKIQFEIQCRRSWTVVEQSVNRGHSPLKKVRHGIAWQRSARHLLK